MCGGAVNEETINHCYKLLQEIIEKYSIEPDLIFAMDESCCFLDKCTHKTQHIGPHGIQQQMALWNENHETATIIPIICADGSLLKPTVIFIGKQLQGKDQYLNPLNALYVCSFFIQYLTHMYTGFDAPKRGTWMVWLAEHGSRMTLMHRPGKKQMVATIS